MWQAFNVWGQTEKLLKWKTDVIIKEATPNSVIPFGLSRKNKQMVWQTLSERHWICLYDGIYNPKSWGVAGLCEKVYAREGRKKGRQGGREVERERQWERQWERT